MILNDFIKNSGANLVYIHDTNSTVRRGRLYMFDLTYPSYTHELKRFLDDYGHSEVLYGVINKNIGTVTAQI